MLRFYDTLSRSLRPFEPLRPGHVRVYACGPTVYRQPHIGNYRTFLFNDVLVRYLRWKGFDVRFVMNLTDVDDKTIAGAARDGLSLDEFTAPVVDRFFTDLDRLGALRADSYPRATHHIDRMVELVRRLIDNGHAYVGDDGSVYFDVSSFDPYGRLSQLDVEGLQSGAGLASRQAIPDSDRSGGDTPAPAPAPAPAPVDGLADEYAKNDARDFALWKRARDVDRQVGAVWDTPWGEGRPGWHLECSAMSMHELGETFDIHTGGEDLVFPHHEDEIAQSEAATGKPFVRYWLHSKHLRIDDAKMSKSVGNVVGVADVLDGDGYPSAVLRYALLAGHYRRELNFSARALDDARNALRRVAEFAERVERTAVDEQASAGLQPVAQRALLAFQEALDDDLNTPAALAALFGLVREGNAALDRSPAAAPDELDALRSALDRIDEVLNVIRLFRSETGTDDDSQLARWVEERLAARADARARRDFPAADAIRDELSAAGILVEDTPQGIRWRKG
ncbi:MAG TPA: cysteine--tRNA ligase [Longimicrobiales bacterium]|nr:cysteine--tRNA ligase [Longimicrobiales bacterium]